MLLNDFPSRCSYLGSVNILVVSPMSRVDYYTRAHMCQHTDPYVFPDFFKCSQSVSAS